MFGKLAKVADVAKSKVQGVASAASVISEMKQRVEKTAEESNLGQKVQDLKSNIEESLEGISSSIQQLSQAKLEDIQKSRVGKPIELQIPMKDFPKPRLTIDDTKPVPPSEDAVGNSVRKRISVAQKAKAAADLTPREQAVSRRIELIRLQAAAQTAGDVDFRQVVSSALDDLERSSIEDRKTLSAVVVKAVTACVASLESAFESSSSETVMLSNFSEKVAFDTAATNAKKQAEELYTAGERCEFSKTTAAAILASIQNLEEIAQKLGCGGPQPLQRSLSTPQSSGQVIPADPNSAQAKEAKAKRQEARDADDAAFKRMLASVDARHSDLSSRVKNLCTYDSGATLNAYMMSYDAASDSYVEKIKAQIELCTTYITNPPTSKAISDSFATSKTLEGSASYHAADGLSEAQFNDNATLANAPMSISIDHLVNTEGRESAIRSLQWLMSIAMIAGHNPACADFGYTWTQIRVMLLKGIHVLNRFKCSEDKVHVMEEFSRIHLDPNHAVDLMFSAFVYTVDCKDCDCTSLEQCEKKRAEEAQKNLSKHRKECPPPKLTKAHGYNGAPWAIMNWSLRVSEDPQVPDDVKDAARATIRELFTPLIERLDECLFVLPKKPKVVFRGIPVVVAQRYRLETVVVFAPFTSTSLVGVEAQRFMKKGAEGTFFIIQIHSPAMIDFVSYFPEQAEALARTYTAFRVKTKTSRTVMQMLGCRYDIVTMSEAGEYHTTAQEKADVIFLSAQKTVFIYDDYMKRYVPSRISKQRPPIPVEDCQLLFSYLTDWIKSGDSKAVFLIGTAGAGKTSATLGCMSYIIQNSATLGGENRPALPFFIALPKVERFAKDGGAALDEYLKTVLQVNDSTIEVLLEKYTVVLLLDSIDEVPTENFSSLRYFLDKSRWWSNCKVIVSCRDEIFSNRALGTPETFLSRNTDAVDVQYVQPFSDEDLVVFLEKAVKHDASAGILTQHDDLDRNPEVIVERLRNMSLGEAALRHPCTLTIAYDALMKHSKYLPVTTRADIVDVYEAFLRGSISTAGKSLDHHRAMCALENVSLSMLTQNKWSLSVRHVVSCFTENAGVDPREILHSVPRRCEDDHDDDADFSFWHKSVAEYLAARSIFRNANCLVGVQRAFSKTSPMVLKFFGKLVASSAMMRRRFEQKCKEDLLGFVLKSKPSADQNTKRLASNALALLSAAKIVLNPFNGVGLAGLLIEDSNLSGGIFFGAKLTNTAFDRCDLSNCALDNADIDGAKFNDCDCGIGMPPIKNTKVQSIRGMHVTKDYLIVHDSKCLWVYETGETAKQVLEKECEYLNCNEDGSRVMVLQVLAGADKNLLVLDVTKAGKLLVELNARKLVVREPKKESSDGSAGKMIKGAIQDLSRLELRHNFRKFWLGGTENVDLPWDTVQESLTQELHWARPWFAAAAFNSSSTVLVAAVILDGETVPCIPISGSVEYLRGYDRWNNKLPGELFVATNVMLFDVKNSFQVTHCLNFEGLLSQWVLYESQRSVQMMPTRGTTSLVSCFDLTEMKMIPVPPSLSSKEFFTNRSISPDSSMVVAWNVGTTLPDTASVTSMWKTDSAASEFRHGGLRVTSADFSATSKELVCSAGEFIFIWEIPTKMLLSIVSMNNSIAVVSCFDIRHIVAFDATEKVFKSISVSHSVLSQLNMVTPKIAPRLGDTYMTLPKGTSINHLYYNAKRFMIYAVTKTGLLGYRMPAGVLVLDRPGQVLHISIDENVALMAEIPLNTEKVTPENEPYTQVGYANLVYFDLTGFQVLRTINMFRTGTIERPAFAQRRIFYVRKTARDIKSKILKVQEQMLAKANAAADISASKFYIALFSVLDPYECGWPEEDVDRRFYLGVQYNIQGAMITPDRQFIIVTTMATALEFGGGHFQRLQVFIFRNDRSFAFIHTVYVDWDQVPSEATWVVRCEGTNFWQRALVPPEGPASPPNEQATVVFKFNEFDPESATAADIVLEPYIAASNWISSSDGRVNLQFSGESENIISCVTAKSPAPILLKHKGRVSHACTATERPCCHVATIANGAMHVWNTHSEVLNFRVDADGHKYQCVGFHDIGNMVVKPDGMEALHTVELDKASKEQQQITFGSATSVGHRQRVRDTWISNSCRWLISAADDGCTIAWDLVTGKELQRFDFEDAFRAMSVAVDAKLVAILCESSLFITDFKFVALRTVFGKSDLEGLVCISRDASKVVVLRGTTLTVFSTEMLACLHRFDVQEIPECATLMALAFVSESRIVVLFRDSQKKISYCIVNVENGSIHTPRSPIELDPDSTITCENRSPPDSIIFYAWNNAITPKKVTVTGAGDAKVTDCESPCRIKALIVHNVVVITAADNPNPFSAPVKMVLGDIQSFRAKSLSGTVKSAPEALRAVMQFR